MRQIKALIVDDKEIYEVRETIDGCDCFYCDFCNATGCDIIIKGEQECPLSNGHHFKKREV